MDKELQTIIDRMTPKVLAEKSSHFEATDHVKKTIAKTTTKKEQYRLSFVPTPMARTSPFFPMSKREKAQRLPEIINIRTPWGKIEISGPKLSIFEEDVLLAILALLKASKKPEKTKTKEGETTYTVRTSMSTICEYLKQKPGKRPYKYIEDAIKRLAGTVVFLEVNEPEKGNKRGKSRFSMGGTILSGWSWDKAMGKMIITLNPYFYEMFQEGLLTYLDLTLRRRLKGAISKALLRFYESHQANPTMHMLTIADAINLRELPPFRLRARVQKGLAELKKIGYLRDSQINKNGIVIIEKGDLPK